MLVVEGYGCPHLSVQFESCIYFLVGMEGLYNDVICPRIYILECNLFVECGKSAGNNVYREGVRHEGLMGGAPHQQGLRPM